MVECRSPKPNVAGSSPASPASDLECERAIAAIAATAAMREPTEAMVAAGVHVLLQSGIVERQTRADGLLVRDIFLAMASA